MEQFKAEVWHQWQGPQGSTRPSEASLRAVLDKFSAIFQRQGTGLDDVLLCLRLALWLDEQKQSWGPIWGLTDTATYVVPFPENLGDITSYGQWVVSNVPHLELYGFNYTKDQWADAGTEGRKLGGMAGKWGMTGFDRIFLTFLRGLYPISALEPSHWIEQQWEDARQRWNNEHSERPYTTMRGFKKRYRSAVEREQRGRIVVKIDGTLMGKWGESRGIQGQD